MRNKVRVLINGLKYDVLKWRVTLYKRLFFITVSGKHFKMASHLKRAHAPAHARETISLVSKPFPLTRLQQKSVHELSLAALERLVRFYFTSYLKSLQPRQAWLALLILDDDKRSSILVKCQRAQCRHDNNECTQSQKKAQVRSNDHAEITQPTSAPRMRTSFALRPLLETSIWNVPFD